MESVLNQITSDNAHSYVDAATRAIERRSNGRQRPRPTAMFKLHYRRAVCGRMTGRSVEATRDDLVAAARYGLVQFEHRREPRGEPRDVWEMRQVAGLLAAFGDADEHTRLDGLPVTRWYSPPKPEFEASALSYRLFNRFLLHRTVAPDDVETLEERLAQAELHPVHNQAIAPIVRCLTAIEHDDAHDFEQSWATLTTAFATVAQYGEFARRIEGLLDPMALGLLSLARRHGFQLTVTSPYAPVDLLDASPIATSPKPVGAA